MASKTNVDNTTSGFFALRFAARKKPAPFFYRPRPNSQLFKFNTPQDHARILPYRFYPEQHRCPVFAPLGFCDIDVRAILDLVRFLKYRIMFQGNNVTSTAEQAVNNFLDQKMTATERECFLQRLDESPLLRDLLHAEKTMRDCLAQTEPEHRAPAALHHRINMSLNVNSIPPIRISKSAVLSTSSFVSRHS